MDNLLTIKIAGICIGIRPLSEGFDKFCSDYIVEEKADFILSASEEDLEEEERRIKEYAEEAEKTESADSINVDELSELEIEKLWVYRQIAERIPEYGALLIHATAVRVDGSAYLFLGPSGAGKTTHAKLWKRYFGDRMRVINDDKPLIRLTDDEILVCGSPWSGKERWQNRITAPLRGCICINQAEENRIDLMTHEASWEVIMNQVYRGRDPETVRRTLELVDIMKERAPVYRLECNRNYEAVEVAFAAVSDHSRREKKTGGDHL